MIEFYAFQKINGMNPEDQFIDQYESSYYLDYGDPGHKCQLAPNAAPSSKYVEDEIERILKSGINCRRDVIHILAWKLGKIRHKESKARFEYTDDWSKLLEYEGNNAPEIPRDMCVRYYSKEENFRIGEIAATIVDNLESLHECVLLGWKETLKMLDSLIDHEKFERMGVVYLITLMYFLSKGKYPIYDIRAMVAVKAIENGAQPGADIEYKELTSVNDTLLDTSEHSYQEYQNCLERIFGKGYQYDNNQNPRRNYDRALWVYGHYFNPIKPLKKQS